MLAPGSFASGEAVGLPAIVKHQRAGQALVSFGYVQNRSVAYGPADFSRLTQIKTAWDPGNMSASITTSRRCAGSGSGRAGWPTYEGVSSMAARS